ncbi:hypothetical protein GCM10022420_004020 [Streptomyces iranensis]
MTAALVAGGGVVALVDVLTGPGFRIVQVVVLAVLTASAGGTVTQTVIVAAAHTAAVAYVHIGWWRIVGSARSLAWSADRMKYPGASPPGSGACPKRVAGP